MVKVKEIKTNEIYGCNGIWKDENGVITALTDGGAHSAIGFKGDTEDPFYATDEEIGKYTVLGLNKGWKILKK